MVKPRPGLNRISHLKCYARFSDGMMNQSGRHKNKRVKGYKTITPEYRAISAKEVFKAFWSAARFQKRSLILMIAFMVVQGAIVGGSIWMVKFSIDLFFEDRNTVSILYLVGALAIATVGRSTMEFFFAWNRTLVVGRIRDQLVVKAFKDLVYNPFHIHIKERDRKKYGWVLTDAMNFIESCFGVFNSWVKQPFLVISTIGALLAIAPFMTLVGIALFPLGIPFIVYLKRRIKEIIAKRKHLIGRVEEVVSESIRCIRIVKVFGLEERQIEKLQDTVQQQREYIQKSAFHAGLISPISELLGLIGLTIILFLGSRHIHSGSFTTGTFFVFIMSFVNIYRPLKEISNGMVNYQMALDAGRRLIILQKNAQREYDQRPSITLGQFEKLQIDDLWFSYAQGRPSNTAFVLRGLDLNIRQGETVALVGATGAGKSTLCDLIFGLYAYQEGAISINGVPLEQVQGKCLKNMFSLCSQETIVFNNTLLEDIRIAQPDASRKEVMAVAQAVGLGSFLNALDRGLDTWIGDRGIHCSGGQRQMIALARAILQKPEFLVLDEAISGIDVETGEKVWENIRSLLPGCTILMISHHLHIIQHCDRVIMLKAGKINQDIRVKDIKDPKQFFKRFSE